MMSKPTKASRALALLAAFCWQGAYGQMAPTTLPTGGSVAAGTASISTSGSNMQITQGSNQAILNWQTFSIGSGAWVNFTQPSVSSVALNRVLGGTPSEIFGRLSANGQVFLTNPGGVLFAPGASVDVGNLFATTLSIRDQDFLAGRYSFSNGGNAGAVVNQGVINVNGYAALAAPNVKNDGVIVARAGGVSLAAGDRVLVDMVGDRLISLSVDQAALNAAAINTGTIMACGGRVLLTARSANALLDTVVNNSGIIRANSLVMKNGEIILCGGSAGVVANSGTLQAAGVDAGTRGGTIKVLGDKVGLFDGTRIDASGDAGGGTVLVGGNFQGTGPEANASHVYIGPDARVNADAVTNGNGGNVSVWSNEGTKFFGSISVRGGAQGGDGGFVETSAEKALMAMGCVDLRALKGKGGTWSLDPNNIKIVAGCGLCNVSQAGPNFCSTDDTAMLGVNKLQTALAACGATVRVTTKSAGANSQAGNIDFCADLLNAGSVTGSTLVLAAANNIGINKFIVAGCGKRLNVNLGGLCCAAAPGVVSLLPGSAIATNGGNLTVNATGGIVLNDTVICAGTGTVKLTSAGSVTQNLLSSIFANRLALTGTANFSLTSPCNQVGTLAAAVSGGHTVSYSDQGSFSIGSAGGLCGINVGATGTVVLSASNGSPPTIGQTKPIVAGGLLLKGNATYNLTCASNVVSNLAGSGSPAINYTNNGPITVNNVAGTCGISAASLTLKTVGASGSITLAKPIVTTSTTTLCASTGISLGADLTANALNLTAVSPINQTAGSIMVHDATVAKVTGATQDITLLGNNDFSSISLTGGTISVNAPNTAFCGVPARALTASATASGALTISTGGILASGGTLSGTDVALTGTRGMLLAADVTATGTLSLTSTDHAINQTAGKITATGATTVSAGTGDITLAQGSNDFSSIGLSGGAISVKDTNSLTVSSLTLNGTNQAVTLIAGGTLTLPASTIDAGTGAIDLRSNGGSLATAGDLAGGDVTLVGSGGISLAHDVTAGGTLTLAATDSAIDQTAGRISATGSTTASAGTGFVSLAQGNNDFSSISLTGGAISVNDANSISLGNVTAGGPISIAAHGASGDLVVASGALVSTTNADISLSAGRDLQLAGTAAVQTTGAGNIDLVSGSAGTGTGTITVATNGAVAVENGSAKFYYNPAAGYGTLTDFSNKVTINACGGTTSSLAWVYARGDNRTYDRTTDATLSLDTAVNGDPQASNAVALSAGSASFDTKDVGTGKTVTYSGYGLTGGASGSFALFGGAGGTTTASMTKLDLDVTGLGAGNKVYTGNKVAALTGAASISPLGSDDVTLVGAAIGRFSDKNVGTGKAVTVTGQTLGGADAGNYNLVEPTTLTANITPKTLVVTGLSANAKVYDATIDATLTGVAAISPLGSDDVTLGGSAVGSFTTKNVGNRSVIVTGNTLSGADAGNYTLVEPKTLRAIITQATLDISGVAARNKVYDATTDARLSGIATVTALGTDSVVLRGPHTAVFASKDAGTAIGVTVSGYTLGGADHANYTLVQPAGLTANITRARLTYTATPTSIPHGSPITGLTGTVAGLLGGDTLQNATTGTLEWRTNARRSSPEGSYRINGSGLSAQNYSFIQAPGNPTALTITP